MVEKGEYACKQSYAQVMKEIDMWKMMRYVILAQETWNHNVTSYICIFIQYMLYKDSHSLLQNTYSKTGLS